jgi:hypothetical protein
LIDVCERVIERVMVPGQCRPFWREEAAAVRQVRLLWSLHCRASRGGEHGHGRQHHVLPVKLV